MTARRDLKTRIRQRQEKTGESYTAARVHVLRTRAELFALPIDTPRARHLDACVLAVTGDLVRVRRLDDRSECIVCPHNHPDLVPGHLVTLVVDRRWTSAGRAHASGQIEDPRIDAKKLGLEPLPLHDGELDDLREGREPFRGRDAYAKLWRRLTATPRPSFEMDPIAWCGSSPQEPDDDPVGDAIDLADPDAAWEALTDLAAQELRHLDAHAHLGNREFDHRPQRALLHYEVGVRIGELSLPEGFDGVLLWGRLYNRPFLRCLHGFGLCLRSVHRKRMPWLSLGLRARIRSNTARASSVRPRRHHAGRSWRDAA